MSSSRSTLPPENEFYDAHYFQIKYANSRWGEDGPGWQPVKGGAGGIGRRRGRRRRRYRHGARGGRTGRRTQPRQSGPTDARIVLEGTSSAFFLSSPRASLSACADSLRAMARPARPMRSSSVSNAARPARRPGERAVRCRRASLGPDGAAVRCGAPARGGSPGAGAYRCRYKTS